MNRRIVILTALMVIAALTGCHRAPVVVESSAKEENSLKENMINANKMIAQSEETQIESYIARHDWNMNKLPNGTRVEVYKTGSGKEVEWEDTIRVVYSLEALNGKTFYSAQDESLVVGHNKSTVGLESAVLGMRRGSNARLIVPSDLGYGVVGDGDRVSSRAVLVYDLTILDD